MTTYQVSSSGHNMHIIGTDVSPIRYQSCATSSSVSSSTYCQPEQLQSISSWYLILCFDANILFSRPSRKLCFQGADLVRLKYCTASAHQVSDGVVRLEPQLLADAGCETPAINYRRSNGRKYRCFAHMPQIGCMYNTHPHTVYVSFRYFYAISSDVAIKHPGRLVKVDTQTSKVSPCRLVYKYMLNGNYLIGKGWNSCSLLKNSPFRWRAGVRTTVTAQSQCTYRSLRRRGRILGCSSAPCSGESQVWTPLPFSFSVRKTSPLLPG